MSALPIEPGAALSDGRLSTLTPLAASGTQPTPSRASTPTCEYDLLLSEWTHGVIDVPPTSPQVNSSLSATNDEKDPKVSGLTNASPEWYPFNIHPEPEPIASEGVMQFGAGPVQPSTLFDFCAVIQEDGPCVDPTTADITVDTFALEPEHEPTPETQPVRAQTKKRKRVAESGPATKKTRKAKDAGASDGGNAGPATEPIIMLIPKNPTFKQLCDLLDVSQVWRPLTEPAPALPDGILCRALAIRPSHGGNNGRVLKDREAVESLTIAGCCGHTKAKQTTDRHVTSKHDHYPRLRERAVTMAEFILFRCGACGFSQEREDIFKPRHLKKTCKSRNEDAVCHRLEDPKTREKAWERFKLLRGRAIREDLQRLPSAGITDQDVAELMSAWDVVPDLICKELREGGYICYTEADIEARDADVENS